VTEQLIKEGWRMREISGFTQHVGPLWTRGSGKDAVFGLEVAEIHLNRRGHLHGGMLATLADNSLAMAVAAAVPGRPIATIQLNVQFVAPARLGDFIEAHCEVVKATRSLVFVRGRFSVGRSTVGEADGIWKILDDPARLRTVDANEAEAEV
jgi:uncharacterized protein (TIGR00369 family)